MSPSTLYAWVLSHVFCNALFLRTDKFSFETGTISSNFYLAQTRIVKGLKVIQLMRLAMQH